MPSGGSLPRRAPAARLRLTPADELRLRRRRGRRGGAAAERRCEGGNSDRRRRHFRSCGRAQLSLLGREAPVAPLAGFRGLGLPSLKGGDPFRLTLIQARRARAGFLAPTLAVALSLFKVGRQGPRLAAPRALRRGGRPFRSTGLGRAASSLNTTCLREGTEKHKSDDNLVLNKREEKKRGWREGEKTKSGERCKYVHLNSDLQPRV